MNKANSSFQSKSIWKEISFSVQNFFSALALITTMRTFQLSSLFHIYSFDCIIHPFHLKSEYFQHHLKASFSLEQQVTSFHSCTLISEEQLTLGLFNINETTFNIRSCALECSLYLSSFICSVASLFFLICLRRL